MCLFPQNIKLSPKNSRYSTNIYVFQLQNTGNHVRLQDIDIELGEVCTAITKYAMSNQNLDIEAVENHELTPISGGNCKDPPEPLNIEPTLGSGGPKSKKLEEDCDLGYITQLDKDGNIQQVPMKFEGDDAESEPNPLADFMASKREPSERAAQVKVESIKN